MITVEKLNKGFSKCSGLAATTSRDSWIIHIWRNGDFHGVYNLISGGYESGVLSSKHEVYQAISSALAA